MIQLFSIAALSFSTLAAQTIGPPQVGFAASPGGALRPVYGVAGNFLLGPPVASKVLSQAFSGSIGLLKTDSALAVFDPQGNILATIDTAPGPAMFAFSPDGFTALAYVPGSNSLVEWRAGKFGALPFRPENSDPETIVAVALPNVFEASLIVQRNGGLWEVQLPLRRARVASQQALPGITAPVLALASGLLVFANGQSLILRKPDNSEIRIAAQLPHRFSLHQMSGDWVQLSDGESPRRFAIRISAGREAFYELPEAGP